MSRWGRLWILSLLFGACGGGQSGPPTRPEPSRQAQPEVVFFGEGVGAGGAGEARLKVSLAQTDEERAQGLMWVEEMPDDVGMLFLFESEREARFWMKNTLIPLDMIFVTEGMEVLGVVESAPPLTETLRGVPGLSRYVVEANGGWARRHGVEKGTKVVFEGGIR